MPRKPTSLDKRRQAYTGAKVAYHGAKALARWGLRRLASRTLKRSIKPRKLNQDIRPVGTGASQSFYRKSYRMKLSRKILKDLTPIRVNVQTSAERLSTAAYGIQKPTSILQFPCSQIAQAFTNLVDSSSALTQQVFLRSIEQEYMISNASSANVFVKIYECTARNDFNLTTTSSVLGVAINQPSGAFDQGVYDVNTGMSSLTLGVTPFQSSLFTQNWIVDKIYHVELGAGRTHKHLSQFSPNTIIHESRSSRNVNLEKVTRGVMILAYGSPINDTTSSSAVSTSLIALNIVRKETSKFQFINPQGQVYYNQQGLGTVALGEHIDEEGNVQNEVET